MIIYSTYLLWASLKKAREISTVLAFLQDTCRLTSTSSKPFVVVRTVPCRLLTLYLKKGGETMFVGTAAHQVARSWVCDAFRKSSSHIKFCRLFEDWEPLHLHLHHACMAWREEGKWKKRYNSTLLYFGYTLAHTQRNDTTHTSLTIIIHLTQETTTTKPVYFLPNYLRLLHLQYLRFRQKHVSTL